MRTPEAVQISPNLRHPDKERAALPDVPETIGTCQHPPPHRRIAADAARGLYKSFHLNFSSSLPRPLLETLAAETLRSDSVHRIAKIYDQHLEFVTLEDNLFSLAHKDTYVQMNDPSAGEPKIHSIVDKIVSGLFCVLATLEVVLLGKYKQDVDEVNRRTGGANNGAAEFDGTDLIGNTKHLMNAVNSLPELTERKKVIDKHTNIATTLLGEIKGRSMDAYCEIENSMLTKMSVDRSALIDLLRGKGTQVDKISKSNIVDWAEKLYGQSISAVTAGMNNLLSGGRQLALTRTVEALMEGKLNPEVDTYLLFDPRAPRSGPGSRLRGPFKEAIVFMIGGGNYVEYMSLMEMGQRSQPMKRVIYGTTELLNGREFMEQLTVLGRKMGLRTTGAAPPQ
ncbi:uncharacterized protein A4U43_C01F2530 [Asparagus officinalis]|uniref:Uncharacterized protein n=1 Tax=Asparagus officinalis TaxID=4686 RepID=A0A5P1FLU7_ASPOF|nr:uncharacterized protein A4U43_C01F2530 [Asparagus officinalis]